MTQIDPHNLNEVRELLQRRKGDLMQRFDAQGVAIGKDPQRADRYVIVVYLTSEQCIPEAPVEVEGVPLQFLVTGGFRIQ